MFGGRLATLKPADGPGASGNSATSLEVLAPPGHVGKTVNVTVTTEESKYAPGGAPSPVTTTATYRYLTSPPSAPQRVKTKEYADAVHVSWVGPLVNGGASITGYRVVVLPFSFSQGKQPKPIKLRVGVGARSAVLPHLHPRFYIAEVHALNKHGAGPPGVVIYPAFLNGLVGSALP